MEAPPQGRLVEPSSLRYAQQLADSFAAQRCVQEVDDSFEAQRIAYDLNGARLGGRTIQTRIDPRRDQSHSSTDVFDDDLDGEEDENDVLL
jgi:hypothetical protein